MNKTLTQVVGGVLGTTLLAATAVAVGNGTVIGRSASASAYSTILNANNSPTIVNEQAVVVDDKGVTWEYQGVQNYNSGHISLKNGGYFGVSPETNYGYTAVEGITVNFEDTNNELWLLKSIDGVDWNECRILTSGDQVSDANDWRYFRFYNWSDDNTNININSVTINYNCSGISSSEDVDGAHIENVITTSGTTAYSETTNVSPLGNSTRAIRFEKISGATYAIIGFGREYRLKDIKDKKVEFDLYATVDYGKTAQLAYNTSLVGSTIDSKEHTSYKVFNLGDHWYHIEIHISALSSMFCSTSQGDIPAADKPINGIKINIGNGVVDNLRIGSVPSSNVTEVGIFNYKFKSNGNICKTNDWSKNYWLKISWTGVFHSCQMIIADTSIAEPVAGLEYPFYITPKAVGSTTVTMKLCVGYNRNYVFAVFTLEIYE